MEASENLLDLSLIKRRNTGYNQVPWQFSNLSLLQRA